MICSFEGANLSTFLDSSMVEHSAVNRVVVGSSPTRGAINPVNIAFTGFFGITETILLIIKIEETSLEKVGVTGFEPATS